MYAACWKRLLVVQSRGNGTNILRNYYVDNKLNTQGRNLLEKLLVPQLVKKLPPFIQEIQQQKKDPNQKHGKL